MAKFKINYTMMGEVEIEAEDLDDAAQKFYDRCGVTDDDIYENLNFNPSVDYIEIAEEE